MTVKEKSLPSFTTKDFYTQPFYYDKPHKGIIHLTGIAPFPGLPEGYVHSMAEWEYAFEPKKNWKVGRSAWALAHFIMEQDGLAQILLKLNNELLSLLSDYERTGKSDKNIPEWVNIDKCIIEKSDPFDAYPNPRKHDLAIYGRVSNKRFKILIEAKVDETFGPTIEETYQASLQNPHSQIHNRIDNLINQFSATNEIWLNALKECRYQLLHYQAAANNELDYDGLDTHYDLVIMLVLVFKTDLYDKNKGIANLIDFYNFMDLVGYRKQIKTLPASSSQVVEQYPGIKLSDVDKTDSILGEHKCKRYNSDFGLLKTGNVSEIDFELRQNRNWNHAGKVFAKYWAIVPE